MADINLFFFANVRKPSIEKSIKEYTRPGWYYRMINQALRRLRSP